VTDETEGPQPPTGTSTLILGRKMTRRDVERAKLERDLSEFLQQALRDAVVRAQPIPPWPTGIEVPNWFEEQLARGVSVRVTIGL